MVYRFDEFEVDDREFRLSEGGTPLQVEPKVLRLLLYLIENRNRLTRKQELLDNVWHDAMVTENALTRVIGLLRKALNDDSHVPRFIETVPTAGYRFIAKVTVLEESPAVEPMTPTATATIPPEAEHGKGFSAKRWLLASAILLLAAIGVASYFFAGHRRRVLTEKDTVVLADFDNSTDDPVFDGTLRQGMAVQLEQSPFLNLLSDERVQQTLRLMGQPADARLTPAVAREICQRTAGAAVLDGSIARLGSQYVLGLRATDCSSGKVLAEEQARAARKEDVLNALDQIASRFRTRLGESLATVEKYDTPLAEATTPSLEALKAYSLGWNKRSEGRHTESLPFFQRAVELDPNFAMAYANISNVYSNQNQPERAVDNIRKAFELREKVSERERGSIERGYYWNVTGETEKVARSLELWQQTYPSDYAAYNALGVLYRRLGNSEKALEQAREAMRLAPNATENYGNLGNNYMDLNRLDEAGAVYKEAEERKVGHGEGWATDRYVLAFLKGDEAQMAQWASSVTGKRGDEYFMLGVQSNTEAWYGRLKNARELIRRAMDSAERNDAKELAALYQVAIALFEVDTGNRKQGLADVHAAMKLAPNRSVQELAAVALARAGDPAAAERLADELDKTLPLATLVQRYWVPVIRSAVALQRKDPSRAIERLQVVGDLELASNRLFPAYLRGEAYLMLHDGNRAAAEFQKFIDHRGKVKNLPGGALARLGLGRAYAMQSDPTKARAAYQDFLTLWKGADPDIPILKQAKAEYVKLQ